MSKVTFKEFFDLEKLSEIKDDQFYLVETDDGKLLSTIKQFAQLVDENIAEKILHSKISIIVNGDIKSPEIWAYLYVDENTEIIITPTFGFGKGGGFLSILFSVALIAAGALLFWNPAGWAWVTMGVQMLGASLMIMGAGMLLMSMFMPDLPQLPELGGQKESKTYTWSGIKSIARTNVPMPVLMGTHKVGGYIIGLFTRPEGNDNYLYMLLAYSEGVVEGICRARDHSQVCTTSDKTSADYHEPAIELNGQLIEYYDDVQWWARNGHNTEDPDKDEYYIDCQNPIPYFDESRIQYDDGREIPNEDGIIFTTRSEIDCVEISLVCPSLYEAKVDGNTTVLAGANVEYKIEYKKATEQDWTVWQPIVHEATCLCQYATVDDDGNVSCLLGGTASFTNCNNVAKTCSFSPSKFKKLAVLERVRFHDDKDTWVGVNKPYNVRVRILEVREEVDQNTHVAYRRQKYSATGSTIEWEWITSYQHTFIMKFEVFKDGVSEEKEFKVKQHLLHEPSYNIADDAFGSYTPITNPNVENYYLYPETITINFEEYKVTFKNFQNMADMLYNSVENQSKVLGEFVLTAHDVSSGNDYGIIESQGGRNPYYAWERLTFDDVAKYDLKISRKGKTSNSATLVDALKLDSVTEIFRDQLIYPNTALIAFKIKATPQLSGQPPNVTLVAKGVKVAVPQIDSGNTSFNDCFWDPNDNRFETVDGSALTDGLSTDWDSSTFVEEYTENFAAHVKNMLTHRRYGLGRQINNYDINFDSWIEALKDCHEKYTHPTGDDFIKWDERLDDDWNKMVYIGGIYYYENDQPHYLKKDIDDKKIIIDYPANLGYDSKYDSNYNYFVVIYPKVSLYIKPLRPNNTYQLEIFVNNLSQENNLILQVTISGQDGYDWYGVTVYENSVTVSGNKITISFDCPQHTFEDKYFKLNIFLYRNDMRLPTYNNAASGHLTGEVTKIKLTETYTCHNHFANGVAESSQTADTFFTEMCNSFRCWMISTGYELMFKINKDETPVHKISSSEIIENSFSQTFSRLSEIPYLLDAQFSDITKDYELNSRTGIVPLVDVDKTTRRDIGLKYIVYPEIVEREIKFQAKQLALCNHRVAFSTDLDFIHSIAGDIIYLEHPLPEWGSGQGGRIIGYDSGSLEITLDKDYTFDGSSSYHILYQNSVNNTITGTVTNSSETTNVITLSSWPGDPINDSSYILGISSTSPKKFRLLSCIRDKFNKVNLIALNHETSLYDLDDVTILKPDHGTNINKNYSIEIREFSVQYFPGTGSSGNFSFFVKVESSQVNYTMIQFSENGIDDFREVAVANGNNNYASWFVQDIQLNKNYYFRAIAVNDRLNSKPVDTSCFVGMSSTDLPTISGIRVFGDSPNTSEFNTKNLVILWNPVDSRFSRYVVRVYKNSVESANLLVNDRVVHTNQFTYLLADNIRDNGGTPASQLVIQVACSLMNNNVIKLSNFSKPFTVSNAIPSNITGLQAFSSVGGVKFSWDQSTEEDHKCYYIRTKVSTGNWSNWFEHDSNEYNYQLNDSEISSYGSTATISIEVKDKDWYEQLSQSAASGNSSAGVIADSIFKMEISANAGSGDLDELVDGDLSSTDNGWVIG